VTISRTALRVVAVERGRVTWAAERALDGAGEIAAALAELAAERPRGFRRARVALAGELVRVKVLSGFPRLSAAKLDRAVALQASRWFLRNGHPLVTRAVRLGGAGCVLAAAVERQALEAVGDGAARAGLKCDGVGTAVAACARMLGDGDHVLPADGVYDRVAVHRGSPVAVRRSKDAGDSQAGPTVPGLDAEGVRFFPAYAVALTRPIPEFAFGADPERSAATRRLALRLAVIAALCWVAAATVGLIRINGAVRGSRRELATLGPALDAAVAVERDLTLADGLLAAVRSAQTARSRDTELLSALTRALPDSAYLLSLRRGRDGRVTVVGFGPSAARVLAALERASGIDSPALQGGVIREMTAGRAVERFILSFGWRPMDRR
jgi:Tfp pilus assembly protein PilN